ncbi:MAG: RidA family protein [Leptothrix sp. (in: b-proteobacteria)]
MSDPSASPDTLFAEFAARLGYGFDGEIKRGGNYSTVLRDGDQVFVSGQVPRVGDQVVVTGRVGADVALADARHAAQICAMRALALLRQELGSLSEVLRLLRVTVFVQCSADFTQLSEVADGASEVFETVLGTAGNHTRTSVGVFALPKNAAVELDLIAAAA